MKLLNEILGTKYPIIQGGMANIATGEFAAACSNAGALGLIGSGGMDAAALRENIRRCRALTDKPFGSASGSNSVVIAPFITPLSRRVRVRLRVSMPSMPMMPFSFKKVSSVFSLRKLEGVLHASRTM